MTKRRNVIGGGVLVLALALSLSLAAPALAAFPGANGLLAVQPAAGHGIVLVTVNGRVVGRLCTDRKRCGTPRRPRWSPNGQSLVFAGPAIRIVYTDGSCLDCLFGAAPNPAFEPGGTKISFIQRGRLTVDGIDTLRQRSPGVGGVTDAAWSATEEVAVVRRGAVWAGRPGRLHQIAPGREPSWSPRADRIAFVQRGWIVMVRLHDHHIQHLARGSAPAFSPDGRWIAFVARGHRLMIIAASGGHPRPVGRVRAASIDWQPKPRGQTPGCVAPPGSTATASNPGAIVTQNEATQQSDFGSSSTVAYMGCLRADGRERLLERFANNAYGQTLVTSAVLAAPFAALVESSGGKYVSSGDVVRVFDLRTGTVRKDLGGESAPCDFPCARLDRVVLGSDGVSAAHWWRTTGFSVNALGQDACAPASTLCVAVDNLYGDIFASADPTTGAQSWTLSGGFEGAPAAVVTCPSASLCVGGSQAPYIFTSVDPVGDQAHWTETPLAGTQFGILGISCPTVSLCVATLYGSGSIATSTNPAGGTQAWNGTQIDARDVGPVVCSAEPRCFVTDSAGAVLTSANPTGGSSGWSVSPTTPPFLSGACPTTSFCVTVNGQQTATTTDPSAGTWTKHPVGDSLDAVSCPSASLCLAVTTQGQLDLSTDPASGTWTRATADITSSLVSVSCASTSLCVATGSAGDVLVSTNPTGGPTAWTRGLLYPACTEPSGCTTDSIEVSDGVGQRTVDADQLAAPGPLLTGLTLSGDTLSWSHEGNPRTAPLTPP